MRARGDWIRSYLQSSNRKGGGATVFVAAAMVVLSFGFLQMWDSGKGPGPSNDGERWSPGKVAAQGFRTPGKSPRPLGSYLLPEGALSPAKRADPARDAVLAPETPLPFNPFADPMGSGLQAHAPAGSGGGKDVAAGASTVAATPKAAAPAQKAAGADRRLGEARPFHSSSLNVRAARRFGNNRGATGGGGGQTNFGGGSTGAAWGAGGGPTGAATAANQNGVGGGTADTAGAADTGAANPLGNQNLNLANGASHQDNSNYQEAGAPEIHQRQVRINSVAQCVRARVGLPSVGALRNMLQAMSDASNPRTIMGAANAVDGATGSSTLNPSIALVRQNMASALVCVQQLTQQSGLPEDPPAAESCHRTAETPIQAYQTWPRQLRAINQAGVASMLENNPSWNLVDAPSRDLVPVWDAKSQAAIADLQDSVVWGHSVRLPSWEPSWEQDIQQAISFLQIAHSNWYAIMTGATDSGKGLLLAEGSRNIEAALAALDRAWPQMTGGSNPSRYGGIVRPTPADSGAPAACQ